LIYGDRKGAIHKSNGFSVALWKAWLFLGKDKIIEKFPPSLAGE
jgi:hypothetical protein